MQSVDPSVVQLLIDQTHQCILQSDSRVGAIERRILEAMDAVAKSEKVMERTDRLVAQ
jgi:hypothetical protein